MKIKHLIQRKARKNQDKSGGSNDHSKKNEPIKKDEKKDTLEHKKSGVDDKNASLEHKKSGVDDKNASLEHKKSDAEAKKPGKK